MPPHFIGSAGGIFSIENRTSQTNCSILTVDQTDKILIDGY